MILYTVFGTIMFKPQMFKSQLFTPQPFYIEWKWFVLLCFFVNIVYGAYADNPYIIIALRTIFWLIYGAVINGIGLHWAHYRLKYL